MCCFPGLRRPRPSAGPLSARALLRTASGPHGCARQLPGTHKDALKHDRVEAARVGIAQRGMVAGEELEAVRQVVLGPVGEGVEGAARDDAGHDEVGEEAIPGDLAEADDDPYARQVCDLRGEVLGTVADLLGRRLVAGRGATDDGGDPGVAKLQAVVA